MKRRRSTQIPRSSSLLSSATTPLKEMAEAASLKIPLTVGSTDTNKLQPENPKLECVDVEDGLVLVQRAKPDDEIPKEQVHNFH